MNVSEVVALLDLVLPETLVEEGDNCGLLIGDLNQEVHHIRVALEVSVEVLEQGIIDGVDMFIVHHPMIYSPLARITSETLRGSKALKIIKNGISLYAAHSNLDRAPRGLNECFGSALGFDEVCAIDADGFILMGILEEPIGLEHYVQQLRKQLNLSSVRYVGDGEKVIRKVAFCTGSGVGLLKDDLFNKADVYVTGDLKYHDAMDIHEKRQTIIDVSHFGSEIMAAQVLYDLVSGVVDTVEITIDNSIINPIKQ